MKKDKIVGITFGAFDLCHYGHVLMFEESNVSIAFGGVHEPIETLLKVSNYLVYEESSLCRLLNTL